MKKRTATAILLLVMCLGMLAGCGRETPEPSTEETLATTLPQITEPVDIRPLPPENPGSSLIAYDPDRQIYISGENVYIDYYIGISNLPSFNIRIYSRERIDLAAISADFPVELPFVVDIYEMELKRKTEAMVSSADLYGTMPYYVYYAYRGADMAQFDTNTQIREDFEALEQEDLPEFYVYLINVAFVNIQELDEPVTLEKVDITLGDKIYEARLGRVRIFPKEAFPSQAQVVRRTKGLAGNMVQLYNDGIVKLYDAFVIENATEDITVTRLWMLEEESEILDISAVITSGGKVMEIQWDGESPIYLYKGDSITVTLMVKNSLTAKLLNDVHMQVATEYTKEESGETVCDVTTHSGGMDYNAYEYYAIIFDGVDMEPYYRDYFYKNGFWWVEEYRGK